MTATARPDLRGWIPIRVASREGHVFADWCQLGERRFIEPFFEQTIEKCLRQPFSLVFRHETTMEALCEWAERAPGVPPAGFIFHQSRCGSTLAARMLAAVEENIVISEAPPIDAVLRVPGIDEAQRIAWLRGMVSALGQPRAGGERRMFIKFDAWHTFSLPLIKAAFPEVPWIFVHRDPLEVLVSQMRSRAAWMVPGVTTWVPPGIDPATAWQIPAEEYIARVLAGVTMAALDALGDGSGRVVNYRDVPGVLCRALGYEPGEDDRAAMHRVLTFDAKEPSLIFEPDSASKTDAASEAMREAVRKYLTPLQGRLEDLTQAATGDFAVS